MLTLSLGVPAGLSSRTLEQAVTNLIERYGITIVVAAGNARGSQRTRDACRFSPGRVPGVITVGATSAVDQTWPDGMTGRCVDLMVWPPLFTHRSLIVHRYEYLRTARP